MKADIDGMRFDVSNNDQGELVVNLDEFTTIERETRYKLGDVRSLFGQMYICCVCLRSDRWFWLWKKPDDQITWRKCDTETAMDCSKWSDRERYGCWY